MPIEIRELVIKATVESQMSGSRGTSTSGGDSGSGNNQDLVNICVEKVLEIIKTKLER